MIPKLRFPEFTHDWFEASLQDEYDYKNAKAHEPYVVENGRYKLINSKFISTEGKKFKTVDRVLTKGSVGDVTMVLSDLPNGKALAKAYYVEEDDTYAINQRICRLRVLDEQKNDSKFFYYLINRNSYFLRLDDGITQTHISKGDVLYFRYYTTQLNEQTRIRDLFNCVDQKINLLTKKKEALDTYKKGLMQKIFSQELRFKREDGTDYPQWETYSIADLGEFFNGLTGKNSSHFGHGNSQYVQYSQVFRNSYIKLDECDNVDVEDSDKQNALKVGDALFTTSSEVADEVAFASILLNKPEIDTYLNSFCFGLRLNSLLAPSFAQYLFRTTIFRKAVYPLAQGSTRYNVSKKEVGKVKLLIPSVEEQNHIAKSFRILDSQIEQSILLKKKTEQLKKGLLQHMFV